MICRTFHSLLFYIKRTSRRNIDRPQIYPVPFDAGIVHEFLLDSNKIPFLKKYPTNILGLSYSTKESKMFRR